MDADRRKEIIAAFGSALEHREAMLGRESDLPYPKSLIRRAIVQEYFEDGLDDRTLDSLGVGLMWLELFLPDDEAALVQKTNAGFEALKDAAAVADNPEETARRLKEGWPGGERSSERWDKAAATMRLLRELRGADEQPAAVASRIARDELDKLDNERDKRVSRAAWPSVLVVGVLVALIWMDLRGAGQAAIVGAMLGGIAGWLTFNIWWAVDAWRHRDYYRHKNELLRAKEKAEYEEWLDGFQRRHPETYGEKRTPPPDPSR